jgi:hypothetical protein
MVFAEKMDHIRISLGTMAPLKSFWRSPVPEMVSAGSLTPLKIPEFFLRNFSYKIVKQFQNFMGIRGQFHWPCWNNFNRVINPAITISARTMTPLKKFQRGHWQCWNGFSGVMDNAETISVGSLTPQKFIWRRRNFKSSLWTSTFFKGNIPQNYFMGNIPIPYLNFKQKKVGEF